MYVEVQIVVVADEGLECPGCAGCVDQVKCDLYEDVMPFVWCVVCESLVDCRKDGFFRC